MEPERYDNIKARQRYNLRMTKEREHRRQLAIDELLATDSAVDKITAPENKKQVDKYQSPTLRLVGRILSESLTPEKIAETVRNDGFVPDERKPGNDYPDKYQSETLRTVSRVLSESLTAENLRMTIQNDQ